tara:strand:- start:79 stop:210 length:132 start_codon:yes stop_codon:yes gene_type:complete
LEKTLDFTRFSERAVPSQERRQDVLGFAGKKQEKESFIFVNTY